MTKNKGFTLVEILTVVVLLGLLAIITFPNVDRYIDEAKEKAYENQVNNIILGAKNWATENKLLLPQEEGEEYRITLETLINEGYLELEITNPKTKKPFSKESEIIITKKAQIYEYEFVPKE